MLAIPLLLVNVAMLFVETALGVVVLLCDLARRGPLRALLVTVFVLAALATSLRLVVGVVFYGLLLVLVWRVVSLLVARSDRLWLARVAGSWDAVMGRWVRPRWRKWRLYDRRWSRVMRAAGLTKELDRKIDEVPRLRRVAVTPVGDSLTVRTLPNHTPEMWMDRADVLRKSLSTRRSEVRRVRVFDEPGRDVRLEVAYGASPLEVVRLHPGVPAASDVDLRAIPMGVTEHGGALVVPILGKHWLVAGITDAGKGSAMWSLVLGLAPLIQQGLVKVWALDPKGGMELWRGWRDGHGLFYRYCDGSTGEMSEMLGEYIALMDARTHLLKRDPSRKLVQPTPEFPLHVMLVDELARIMGRQESRDLEKQLHIQVRDAINVGRAPGFSFCGFLQSPTLENMAHRNEVPIKMALRLEGEGRTDLILGPGSEHAGFRCHEIDPELPGVGYGRFGKGAEVVAFRLFYPTDAQIADAVQRFTPRPVEVAVAMAPKLRVVPDLADAPASGSS